MEQSMYETLLEMPLFQGLAHNDVTEIVASAELDFLKLEPGKTLFREGDTCTGLSYVISGKLTVRTSAANGTWHVEEEAESPTMFGLDVLYGTQRTHRRTYIAAAPTSVMQISKRTVNDCIARYEVFRLNVLNNLTTQAVRATAPLWLPADASSQGRVIGFMRTHVTRPAGHKRFNISMSILGNYLGMDQRYVSATLHSLEQQGLLSLDRRTIDIPAFEDLLRDFQPETIRLTNQSSSKR